MMCPSQLHVFFFLNPLNPIHVACMCMASGPSTEAWSMGKLLGPYHWGELVPQLPVAPQLEVGSCEPFYPCCNVDWSCTGNHCGAHGLMGAVQCSAVQSSTGCASACVHACELSGVGSFLLPCGSQWPNSDGQAWQRALLSTEPSHCALI